MKILRTDVAGFILLGTAVMNCAAPAAGLELEQKGQAVQATPAVELEQKGPAITPAPPEPVTPTTGMVALRFWENGARRSSSPAPFKARAAESRAEACTVGS